MTVLTLTKEIMTGSDS